MSSSPAATLASRFLNEPTEDPIETPPRLVSVRLPVEDLTRIDAMAEHTGLSRNAMMIELLRVGVAHTLAELPDAIRDDIADDASRTLAAIQRGEL